MSVKKLVAKYVAVGMLTVGFMVILGAVGSMDNDAIELLDALKRILVGLVVFAGGFVALAYAGTEEVQNER